MSVPDNTRDLQHLERIVPRPRKHLVNVEETPYYHVTSRCVRRAFLCGVDDASGKDYEHRRQWLEDRIRLLSSIFAIDLCAYAVMSNHYHIVLRLTPGDAELWTNREVINRWRCLYRGTLLVQKFSEGEALLDAEKRTVEKTISIYRDRLKSLSWFMKCLNEPIARMANREDECTGHFWESRFTSQALLTDRALLSSMVYVDLNPIRANLAKTPEESDHTSIRERIDPRFDLTKVVRSQLKGERVSRARLNTKPLVSFSDDNDPMWFRNSKGGSVLPFRYVDYLRLVDQTGRILRPDKQGAITGEHLPILERLDISRSSWLTYSADFEQLYRRGVFNRSRCD